MIMSGELRIGDSYFAHKKIVINKKASGSLEKEYVIPPIELLNFVVHDRHVQIPKYCIRCF